MVIISVVLIGFGLGFILLVAPLALLIALYQRQKTKKFEKNCTYRVMATLVDVEERVIYNQKGPDSHLFLPTYAYDISGLRRKVQDKVGSYDPKCYTIGTEVEMLVDPMDASHFKIEGLSEKRWRDGRDAALILWIVGVVLTLLGAIIYHFV